MAYTLYRFLTWVFKRKSLRYLATASTLLVLVLVQVRTAFSFTNDPSANGLAVGRELARLQQATVGSYTILLERSYWDYLSIQVGANSISDFMFDREADFVDRSTESWILADSSVLRTCLKTHSVKYIVVKTPEIVAAVEQKLEVTPITHVNGYLFYSLPNPQLSQPLSTAGCPRISR
ncbi:MAG: hypothetical protein H7Z42_06730 [Roseiflexaceae bacterium]|nr:hypothetical protein [Roseiflexaceae bacterium]